MGERSALDKSLVRASFERAAATYDEAAGLQRTVGDRLLERLSQLDVQPHRILDVGAGTGRAAGELARRFPSAELVALDLAHGMLVQARPRAPRGHFVTADAEHLPLVSAGFDLLFSNLTVQWCHDVAASLREFRRVLRPGGLIVLATFGTDTLHELRSSWETVDQYVHVNTFIDERRLADALTDARFAGVATDTEIITAAYADVRVLMRQLKAIGAHNVNFGRSPTLTGKDTLLAVARAYETYRQGDGLLPATHNVIYARAVAT